MAMNSAYYQHGGVKANSANVPGHVAIIMDGNGRWALERQFTRTRGHRMGMEAAHRIVRHCIKRQIPYLTLFAFGQENWKRPSQEVRNLFRLLYLALKRDLEKLHKDNIQINIIGEKSQFAAPLQKAIVEAEMKTANNTQLTLNLAINYSGRWDLLQAINRVYQQQPAADIEEKTLQAALSLGHLPEPDLFIRTGGAKRLSNFLLWELAYTELYFTNTLWPDFTETEFDTAISSFAQTERRFGLISEQIG